MIRLLVSCIALSLLISGCGPPPSPEPELRIFAAASLQDALQSVADSYRENSSVGIVFNFASSNTLARQIVEGGRADLFFSADEARMETVAQEGLIEPDSRIPLLSNRLAVIVPSGSEVRIEAPEVLLQPALSPLALGDPEAVPAGVYARQFLEKAGLWNALKDRVAPALNVRAAMGLVATGAAPIGIVYPTDAAISDRVKIVYEIPEDFTPRMVYPAAILRESDHPKEAGDFLRFCQGAQGRAIFERYGFQTIEDGQNP
jgi:molybdate transport system substrate-binding protein